MASGRLTPNDIDHIFAVFDSDKSGSISIEEYKTALIALGHGKVTSSEAVAMMEGRPTLNKQEFTEIIRRHAEQPNSMAEARRAFALFDPKNTGKLTTDLLLRAGNTATGAVPSLELIDRILNACDQDNDNGLNFQEFVAAVTLKLKLTPDPPKNQTVAVNDNNNSENNNNNNSEKNNDNGSDQDEVDEPSSNNNADATVAAIPAGSQIRKVLGKDVVFGSNGLLSRKGARDGLILLGYPEDVLSDGALQDLFDEQDSDRDGFLTYDEFKDLLAGLGEFD